MPYTSPGGSASVSSLRLPAADTPMVLKPATAEEVLTGLAGPRGAR
ncbi:hypothetical protein [Streptomyces achromogenes]